MKLFELGLAKHREELNSLNVYPVPDGDTGTNLLLTQQAVTSALLAIDSGDPELEAIALVVARASLMGARGNSGVILSQVLRGICEALPKRGEAGAKQLAAALEHSAYEAYRAVAKPAEGTMLSVLRDVSAAARKASKSAPHCGTVLTASLVAARESLDRTMEVNTALRRAGVVDAGGKGIVLLLDALRAAVTGEPMTEPIGSLGPLGNQSRPFLASTPQLAYEVQYLLEAQQERVPSLRRELESLGDSVVVVGGGGLFNVHVHTHAPDPVVKAGRQAGTLYDLSVASLSDQVEACIGGGARAVRLAEETSMVAVADGDGLVRAFASLGAIVVFSGGADTDVFQALLSAINGAPSDAVVVLPNHPEAIATAEGAAAQSSKRAVVVPAMSVATGLSAAAAFNPVADVDDNLRSMKEALDVSRSGSLERTEVDQADHSVSSRAGDWLAEAEGHLLYAGRSLHDAARVLSADLVHPDAELVTLIVGKAVEDHERESVRSAVASGHPDIRIEVFAGHQLNPPFVIGVE